MILPYNKTNKSGEKVKYWTHSSFVENEKFEKIIAENQTRMKYRNYLGLFGFIVGLKVSIFTSSAFVNTCHC